MKTAAHTIREAIEEANALAEQIIRLSITLVGEPAEVQMPREVPFHCGGYMGEIASSAEFTKTLLMEARQAIARIQDAFEYSPNLAVGEVSEVLQADYDRKVRAENKLVGARRGY